MNETIKRTDPHRPGAIIPADYDYFMSFSGASSDNSWPIPPINVDAVIELKRTRKFANIHSSIFQCDVCGAHYVHGDVWEHRPSGEFITIGHECAAKYSLFADYSDWNKVRGSWINKEIRKQKRFQAHVQMRETLRDNPGLGAALKVDNEITQDIRSRFIQYGTLSSKQIELLRTLKKRADERAQEIMIEAPEGRFEVTGTVLSTRVEQSPYGETCKMLVKVDTAAGSWKTWGTVPKSLWYERHPNGSETFVDLKGRRIKFTATVKRSDRDSSFSFFSRPSKGSLL